MEVWPRADAQPDRSALAGPIGLAIQYGWGSSYALGAVTSSSANTYKNGSFQSSSTTTTSYDWYDGAVQTRVDYSSQGSTFHTYYTNDASGQLVSANVQDGRPRWITVTRDALGQAIRRDEADTNYTVNGGGDPHEIWYRFNGRQIGYIGNNGSDNGDYTASIAQRTAPSPGGTPGAFRGGASYGAAYADFDQNYDAINTYAQGSGGGVYTVRQGDTLSSIAAQLWGDASLWYKLAEANGLSGDTALTVGQTLSTPAGVNKAGNTAGTFRPYDPSDAYGDTSPTTPKPQAAKNNNNCGVFGAIVRLVITVVVSAFVPVIPIPIIGPAISAAVVSTASQGISTLVGLQDHIDWNQVGLSALSAGVSSGLDKLGVNNALGINGNGFFASAARGALSSAVTQGIGTAVGLQSHFDLAGVAVAGISSGVATRLGPVFAKTFGAAIGKEGVAVLTRTASGLAAAATRSLVEGSDFGDNIVAELPDIIGQTIGGFVADKVASIGASGRAANATKNALIDNAADQLGLAKGSPERAAFIAAKSQIADDLHVSRRIADIRKGGSWSSDGELVSDVVTNIYDYSEANTSRAYEVLLGDGDFNVNLRTPVFSKLLDPVDIQAGHLSRAIDKAVEDHPVLGAGLTIVGVGLAIADPVGAGLSIALTGALKQGEGPLSQQFAAKGYGQADASAGGAGLPFILGIAGGFGVSKVSGWIGGKIEGLFSSTLGRLFGKGAAESAPLFKNLSPLDEIVSPELFPASQIQKVGYNGKLDYVVTQSGELVLGKSGHISLSGGADVLAAGEARFVKGAVRRIDNVSGHYRPSGPAAQSAAEAAFNRAGFNATGKYIEKGF